MNAELYQHDHEFHTAHRRAVWGNRLAKLRRRPTGLRSYHETRRQLVVTGESYRGIRTVPVDQIVGSTDRCHDFDAAFRPLRTNSVRRWVSVASGYDAGRSLPPVQLYQLAGAYFVRDGHHRVSVARVRGQGWVEAEVIEVLAVAPLPTPPAARPAPTTGARRPGWAPLQHLAEVVAGMAYRTRLARRP
jgi:hypothetical protein